MKGVNGQNRIRSALTGTVVGVMPHVPLFFLILGLGVSWPHPIKVSDYLNKLCQWVGG